MTPATRMIGPALALATLLGAGAAAAQTTATAAAPTGMPPASPTDLVDALNGVFGKHPARGSHAKGFCFAGQFEASAEAAQVTRAAFFRAGTRTPLIGRFSIGGGNPKAPDNAKSVRGIAVRVAGGGEQLDWVFISAPHFFAQTPEQFVQFFKVRTPDPATGKPNADAIAAFSRANPATTRQAAYIAGQPVPASFATVPYWSTNAFIATNVGGKQQAVRWRFQPVAGRVGLTDEEAKAKGADFLAAELAERLKNGPTSFDVIAQIARDGDQLTDPTEPWAQDRAEVKAGRIAIDRITGQACDRETFLPTTLPAGIAPTADPILAARGGAYGVSLGRRLSLSN